ncbi:MULTISPECIES: TetR/AcrR family transcriptional regulator [Actinoplanes]|uniref:TetR/AcrR family transcriptional regulator n=1 Tax=Actinoplanes TaxID=1865 RepID=UPI0005F2A209|nr:MULTISPECIES: TetR/AcrR family transcriptional regulator [Actinoplanes]GLY04094.1 TetR family transcriptional regulator [Actinoplanes sp. NBRC 101535]
MARPRKFDEEQVLRSATEAFWNAGFAATSLDDLMQATGLGKGSLYGAFGDKQALFQRVLDGYCATSTAHLRDHLDGPGSSSADRLRDLFDTMVTALGQPGPHRSCLLAKSAAELAATNPEVADRARQTFVTIAGLLQAEIEKAQVAGDVPADRDARRTARHLLAVLRGMEALAQADVGEDVLRDAADAALEVAGLRRDPAT